MKTRFLAHAHHEQNNPEGSDSLAKRYPASGPTGKTTFEVHVPSPFTWELLASASVDLLL